MAIKYNVLIFDRKTFHVQVITNAFGTNRSTCNTIIDR